MRDEAEELEREGAEETSASTPILEDEEQEEDDAVGPSVESVPEENLLTDTEDEELDALEEELGEEEDTPMPLGEVTEISEIAAKPVGTGLQEDFFVEVLDEEGIPQAPEVPSLGLRKRGLGASGLGTASDEEFLVAADELRVSPAVKSVAPPVQVGPDPPPPGEVADKEDADDSLAAELAEIDFFIDQEMYQEALEACNELLERGIATLQLEERMTRLREKQERKPDHFSQPLFKPGVALTGVPGIKAEGERDFQEVLVEFKEGIRDTVKEGDSHTHYELGKAYVEMGLLDDAISEFALSLIDPGLRGQAMLQLGRCYLAKGNHEKAISNLEEVLRGEGEGLETGTRASGLFYLGEAYQHQRRFAQAFKCYQQVYSINPNFKNVAYKIKEVRQHLGS